MARNDVVRLGDKNVGEMFLGSLLCMFLKGHTGQFFPRQRVNNNYILARICT